MIKTFIRNPLTCVLEDFNSRDCVAQCDGCRRLGMGLLPEDYYNPAWNTHYPLPAIPLNVEFVPSIDGPVLIVMEEVKYEGIGPGGRPYSNSSQFVVRLW